jgi:hypothetical protein
MSSWVTSRARSSLPRLPRALNPLARLETLSVLDSVALSSCGGSNTAASTIPAAPTLSTPTQTTPTTGLPWTYDLDPGRMALPERETGQLHPGNPED